MRWGPRLCGRLSAEAEHTLTHTPHGHAEMRENLCYLSFIVLAKVVAGVRVVCIASTGCNKDAVPKDDRVLKAGAGMHKQPPATEGQGRPRGTWCAYHIRPHPRNVRAVLLCVRCMSCRAK